MNFCSDLFLSFHFMRFAHTSKLCVLNFCAALYLFYTTSINTESIN